MVFAVVVTANHYVMDAIGAALVVIVATAIALGWELVKDRRGRPSGDDSSGKPVVIVEARPRATSLTQQREPASAGETVGPSG
jgi:hypothetical protein